MAKITFFDSANILTELDIAMLYVQHDNNVIDLKQLVLVKPLFSQTVFIELLTTFDQTLFC